MNPRFDVHTHVGVELTHYLTGQFPYGQQYEGLCADLDAAGIGRVVVFPMVSHLSQSIGQLAGNEAIDDPLEPLWTAEPPTPVWSSSRFPYEFENRRLLEEIYGLFPDLADRAVPLVMIDPSREPARQIAAIEALADTYPVAGLKLQGTMIKAPVRDLPDSGFLNLARRRNWPVLIHSSVHPDDPWSQVDDILDVVEAAPEVRFNVAHTLRFDLPGLERLATLANAWFDVSAFCIHCDLAAVDSPVVAPASRRFDTDYSSPAQALHDVAAAWPRKVMWGSDAPYYSYVAVFRKPDGSVERYDLRSSMARETAALMALPPALLDAATVTNPSAWLFGD